MASGRCDRPCYSPFPVGPPSLLIVSENAQRMGPLGSAPEPLPPGKSPACSPQPPSVLSVGSCLLPCSPFPQKSSHSWALPPSKGAALMALAALSSICLPAEQRRRYKLGISGSKVLQTHPGAGYSGSTGSWCFEGWVGAQLDTEEAKGTWWKTGEWGHTALLEKSWPCAWIIRTERQ